MMDEKRVYYCPRCGDHFSSKGDICPGCGATGELG